MRERLLIAALVVWTLSGVVAMSYCFALLEEPQSAWLWRGIFHLLAEKR